MSVHTDHDNVDEDATVLLFGCGCCNAALSECGCNCSGENECVCLQAQYCCNMEGHGYRCVFPRSLVLACGCIEACCPPQAEQDSNTICQLGLHCIALGLKCPTTVCKAQSQVCCVVVSGALPPDAEIVPTAAVLGVQCYPAYGCCKTIGALRRGGAPPSQQMQR